MFDSPSVNFDGLVHIELCSDFKCPPEVDSQIGPLILIGFGLDAEFLKQNKKSIVLLTSLLIYK